MTYDELIEILEQLNLPIAYNHFKNAVNLPYITIEDAGVYPYYADDINYLDRTAYDIHYHFQYKNPLEENKIKSIFQENQIAYDITGDVWIESDQIYRKTYEVTI